MTISVIIVGIVYAILAAAGVRLWVQLVVVAVVGLPALILSDLYEEQQRYKSYQRIIAQRESIRNNRDSPINQFENFLAILVQRDSTLVG